MSTSFDKVSMYLQLRLAKIKTNFGSIDVPKLELSAHGTFAKDDRRRIRQRGSGSQVDDIRDLRLAKLWLRGKSSGSDMMVS